MDNSSLKILSLNVFCRPNFIATIGGDMKNERLEDLVFKLAKFDIVSLQELFYFGGAKRCENFTNAAKSIGFKYEFHAETSKNPFPQFVDSGLIILSKFPIIKTDFIIFTHSSGIESIVGKGALYSLIEQKNLILHVFTTHLQAGDYTNTRKNQIDQLCDFLDNKMKDDNLGLLMGDFNVDSICEKDLYSYLLEKMDEKKFDIVDTIFERLKKHPVTNSKGHGNIWMSSKKEGNGLCIDYIFLIKKRATNERDNRSNLRAKVEDACLEEFNIKNRPYSNLSDHFGICAEINV